MVRPMPTTFVKGDLFHTDGIRAYAHGCNCAGTMDAGVAVAFKKRWPRMFEEYRLRCADGRFHLGDVFVWNEGDEVVYNLALQEHWKKKSKLPALATKRSSPESSSIARSTTRAAASRDDRSPSIATADPPAARIASHVSWAPSRDAW